MIYNLKDNENLILSKNFKLKEFGCKDNSNEIIIDNDLITLLQILRDKINKPIKIISGYRTITYNNSIGGAINSYHCKGQAVDISCNVDLTMLAIISAQVGFNGIGVYDNYIHLDIRNKPYVWINKGE